MLVWSCARLGYHPRAFLRGAELMATAAAPDFSPQSLANLMWGLARLGQRCQLGLCAAVEQAAAQRVGEFRPQELLNLLWAFVTFRCAHV